MTQGELKFGLQVEMMLNRIPQPEYRQLMVEAMMVLILMVKHDLCCTRWEQVFDVDKLVHLANEIFIHEQVSICCFVKSTAGYVQLLLPGTGFITIEMYCN